MLNQVHFYIPECYSIHSNIVIPTQQEIFKTLQFWRELALSQAKHHSLNKAKRVFHCFWVV